MYRARSSHPKVYQELLYQDDRYFHYHMGEATDELS